MIVATGPPLKDRPKNSVILVRPEDDVQTLKGFIKEFLEQDKASGTYQLHLTLSIEEEAEEEDNYGMAKSPPRTHKQPKTNIGPIDHSTAGRRKGKAKVKKEIKEVRCYTVLKTILMLIRSLRISSLFLPSNSLLKSSWRSLRSHPYHQTLQQRTNSQLWRRYSENG